jgi:hypothetical protein
MATTPPTMTPGEARAQAKAAKAYAKAQRPFYRKKRYWLLAVVVVIIIAAIAGSSGSKNKNTPTAAVSNTNGIATNSNNSTHPPQADVTITGCSYDSTTTFATANVKIVNHSSKRSDYLISVDFQNSSGAQLANNFVAGGDKVDAGQTALTQAVDTLSAVPDKLVCKIKSVDRTASS